MRILELEIKNVRGVRDKIHLTPNGDNLVVFGPNGSGKSAIVDAVDFLFTGDMSRLSGRGTRGMTLKEHGPHIDKKPEDAIVKAKIQVREVEDVINLERQMSDPKNLIITPELDDPRLIESLHIAERGQHVLSRSEILKFIAAEAGRRAEEIQAVLNIESIEKLRKTLGTLKREADRDVRNSEGDFQRSVSAITTNQGIEIFSEDEVLKNVNEFRALLKGDPLDRLDPTILHRRLEPPSSELSEVINLKALIRALESVNGAIMESGSKVFEAETRLRREAERLHEDEALRRELTSKQLIDLGVSLLGDSGSCPLCLKSWEPAKLKEFLEARLLKASEAEKVEKTLLENANYIRREISLFLGNLDIIQKQCTALKQDTTLKDVNTWIESLNEWSQALANAVEKYPQEKDISDEIRRFFAPERWGQLSQGLVEITNTAEKLTPVQKAWDSLTELKPILERYFDDKKELENKKLIAERATILSKTYTNTKDRVLEELYSQVNDDFTRYYKFLHDEDESSFSSQLKPKGAQLDFKVDFYGRGTHHPRALHSEGHQDSMGLCLYLALNRKISEDKVDLIILDDVVMSIDNKHRRNVCKLLTEHFKDRQFLITTHDKTWARQLRSNGVVKSMNMVEFKGWNVDTGPRLRWETDVWSKIPERLSDNDVSQAAHLLREHCEFVYAEVCDFLRAPVTYKPDAGNDLGDYLKGAKSIYYKYLKKAIKAANSWDREDEIKSFEKIKRDFDQIVKETQMEHWTINSSVHYNNWVNFSSQDFQPVALAFRELEEFFKCSKCQGILAVTMREYTSSVVKCPCGYIAWNLEEKR